MKIGQSGRVESRFVGAGEAVRPSFLISALLLHSGIKVDVMPLDEGVLGFSNRWYEAAIATAEMYEIAEVSIPKISSGV